MQERYPYIRFVVGVAEPLSAAVALILFFGGTLRACESGGFTGFIGFLLASLLAAIGYVATMVSVESLRALLDVEERVRRLGEPPAERSATAPR